MMHSKTEKDDWLSIQNNKIWDLLEEENGILPALKLSFDHLPSLSLKQCFAYCSMFPKDVVIEKDNLVQLWMAQGLLQPSQGEMEDLGNIYFNILLGNSLLQDTTKDEYNNITNCKMHDLVHDLAQYVSRVESLTLEPNKVNDKLEIQHLSLIPTGEILPIISKESAGKVRTLFSIGNVLGNVSSNFKGLRVLNLEGVGIEELPTSIGKLKHLRYLDVSGTSIKAFPKFIANLYNLQTLRLNNCKELKEFPSELKNLINLRHFCIDDYYPKRMMPPVEMGRLTSLQTLPYFVVGKERGHGIEELGCLKKLRGELRIHNLEHVRDGEEAKKANLPVKTNIYKLLFEWSGEREGNNNNEDVLEGLQPHPNLKSLEIWGFAGDKFPSWMTTMMVNLLPLNNLVEIKLSWCNKCEQIPMLGHLPCLRDLKIGGMPNVKRIGAEFYGYNHDDGASNSSSGGNETRVLFPALKTFTLRLMRSLVEWMPATGVVFPCLEKLSLEYCRQLITAPRHFSSLRKLTIKGIDSRIPLANISSNLTTLTSLTITQVARLSFLLEGPLQNNKNLASLGIEQCPALTYITPDVSGCCTFLRSLNIRECEKLSYLPGGLHTLLSLEVLTIDTCPNLESIPSIHGLTSLRKLQIESCDALTSLPSGLESCVSLENLTVQYCPNLISVPKDLRELPSLYELTINGCGKLKCLLEGLTSLKTLSIGGMSEELKSLPDQLQHLTALTYLCIINFDGVEALPGWLGNLSSLENLCITRCKNLMYLPTGEAMRCLTKLELLTIDDCPLLKERCAKESGPEWSKISHIPNIRTY